MKRCFPSYVITEMQIKTMKYHCTPIRKAKIWNTDNIKCWWAHEATEINYFILGIFPDSSVGKESALNVGDPGSIPGLGRSPGEGKSYLLQYSGLENSMDSLWDRKELDMTEWLSLSFDGGNAEWSSDSGRQFGCLVVPYNT